MLAIAQAIDRPLANQIQAEQIDANGMRAAEDVSNWRREEEKLLKLYRKLEA